MGLFFYINLYAYVHCGVLAGNCTEDVFGGLSSFFEHTLSFQLVLGSKEVLGSVDTMLYFLLGKIAPSRRVWRAVLTWLWLTRLNHGMTWKKIWEYRELRAATPCIYGVKTDSPYSGSFLLTFRTISFMSISISL